MGNINVAIVGELDYGRGLGKKGTESDMTYFDFKKGPDTLTMVEPTRFPDKLSSLFFSLYDCQYALVVVKDINAALGEAIIALDALDRSKGAFVLKDYHTEDEVLPLIKGTCLENYTFLEDEPTKIKEMLIEMASAKEGEETPGGSVPIDHFFNVKGTGTVILGTVASGTIRKHDKLTVYPTGKWGIVRSIQKHDDEHSIATLGDRVGLALKNLKIDELDRGHVLSSEELGTFEKLKLKIVPHRFWKKPLEAGMALHIGHWMQFLPAKVEASSKEGEGYILEVSLEKPMVMCPGDTVFVSHLDTPKLRVVGKGTPV